MKNEKQEWTETKLHVLRAGRELLIAAEGALEFCKHYVEKSGKEPQNQKLMTFFSRALDVVTELGSDLILHGEEKKTKTKKRKRL
ncbi:MAG: hypothetical protein HY465_02645 [Deltaproteobacteria bacterium]|nr:hypothetical protein [Deltaproteobacteria bacterium]